MSKIQKSPATLFLILSIFFGTIWVFVMPAGAGFDEETHLARIFEISRGHLIPNSWLGISGNGIPQSMLQVSYRQQQFLQPLTWADVDEGLIVGINGTNWIVHKTRATYSPIFYLPQAFLLAFFGYLLNTPILLLYWLLRLSYLLTYVVTCYFAIRLIPKFKWTLFVVALAPMAMIQAVTISADPLTNGMSFLFISWTLFLVEGKITIDRRIFWVTILLVILLFNVKPNSTPLVLMLALLKPAQFTSRKVIALLWLMIAALFVFEVVGWTMIQFQAEAAWRGQESSQTRTISTIVFGNPTKFILDLANYTIGNLPAVLRGYVASFGYGYYEIPSIIFPAFWISLSAAILHDWQLVALSHRTRIALFLEFLFLFFGTFASRYFLKLSVEGLILSQGRYFIPIIPLLVFSLFGGQLQLRSSIPYLEKIFAIGSVFLLSMVTVAMYLVYYVPCGMYLFTHGQCVLPAYKNWGPSLDNSLPVNSISSLEQIFQPDCGRIYDLRLFTFKSPNIFDETKFSLSIKNLATGIEEVNQEYSTSIIMNGEISILDFSDFKADTNAPYSIQITSSNPTDSFTIALSDRHRIRGTLSQTGKSINNDLLFQYRCSDN